MKLSRVFVQRPVGATMLALGLLLAGALAWRLLPVAPLPQVDVPVVEVSAALPGAGPKSMAATVSTPLERALGSIAGVASIYSSSAQGSSDISLEFDFSRNVDDAAREVQAAINAAAASLPAGLPELPSLRKSDPSQAAILSLALASPSLPPSALYDAASTVLAQRLSQITGVGEVALAGASLPAVRVQLDPARLALHGVSLEQVREALQHANGELALGAIDDGTHQWQLRLADVRRRAADFAPLVLREQGGAVLRLSDVANVTDATENRYSAGFHNDDRAVVITVSRRVGANIVETVDAIHAALPRLRALAPPDTTLTVVMDRSPGIRATLRDAQLALAAAVALVAGVSAVFLGSGRAAAVPVAVVPVALVGSFAAMYLAGFSLNNLSLMALIVSAGLVVDDAIIVLENTERHIAAGLTPPAAALRGADEVGPTLVAMTATLSIAFCSVLFMGGLVERLFREFALTLMAALGLSLALSLTFTPALCARWLRPRVQAESAWLVRLRAAYGRGLTRALDRPYAVLALLAALALLAGWLFTVTPKGMLPEQDTGQLRGLVRGDDGFSFQVMQPKLEPYRRLLLADPAVQDVTGTAGGSNGLSNIWINVRLKPLAERGESAQAVVERLRRNAPVEPGALMILSVAQDIQIGGEFGDDGNGHDMVLLADSLEALLPWEQRVVAAMKQLPELVDVDDSDAEGTQQVVIDIDREAARRLGVELRAVTAVLENSYAQRQVATLYTAMNQYRVVMEVDPRRTAQPASLDQVEVVAEGGRRVPLASFATWRRGLAVDRVWKMDGFVSAWIGYDIAPGVSRTAAETAINRMLAEIMLPGDIFRGPNAEERRFGDVQARQPLQFLALLLAMFLVLGVLYESTLHPLAILSTLPAAGLGAFLALQLTGMSFDLIALLGLFLLVGIVMKNAILIVDVAIANGRAGMAPREAVHAAALQRLRPILMANLTGILVALPLAIGFGEGAELRRPLGVTIVGGLALSQLLTLFTTPVVWLQLERLRQRTLARWRPPVADPAAPGTAATDAVHPHPPNRPAEGKGLA